MMQAQGPGSPFQLLFTEESISQPSLPEPFRQIYPGDWSPPAFNGRPYIYTNFAQSRDGRISFNAPGLESGGVVTGANPHDRWLMGLLRARADAILMGDVTLRVEPDHIWTAEFICPPEASAFAALRRVEGYSPTPLLVILSFDGNLNFEAECFKRADLHILVATTIQGVAEMHGRHFPAKVEVHNLGEGAVDLPRLAQLLYRDYGVRNLLCEGGATVFANMLAAGLVDEEFVTLCPTFIGRSSNQFRPSYCEGVAWLPENAPYSKPITLHRAGDFLFMRTRCHYKGL